MISGSHFYAGTLRSRDPGPCDLGVTSPDRTLGSHLQIAAQVGDVTPTTRSDTNDQYRTTDDGRTGTQPISDLGARILGSHLHVAAWLEM